MVADELHRGGIVARVVGEVGGGEIVGHVEGHVIEILGAVGDLGKVVVLHQMADGGVVVAEQDLYLIRLPDETGILGGKVAVVLVPHGGGVVLVLLIENGDLLALGQRGLVGIAKGGVRGEGLHLGGDGGGEEGSPNKEEDGAEDQNVAYGFHGDTGNFGHYGLAELFAHSVSSLSVVAPAASARSRMKRSLSRAFWRMISADRVSMTPFLLAPLVSVSLR